jgi:predicted PhzF superfamily epimerase YddE/YHI9
MMRTATVDMFGTAPGQGSAVDVLLPDLDRPCDEEAVEKAAAHAAGAGADETVLVSECSRPERTFASRIFNAEGETPFGTHSLAGTAACLVATGHLPPGEVRRTSPAGNQPLWTDGHGVRVPFEGPAVCVELPHQAYAGAASSYTAGVGRGFTIALVDQDPRALRPPDLDAMRAQGATDLTLVRLAGRRVQARVFAPGFAIPEDAGCLPVAAALGLVAVQLDPALDGEAVTVSQVTARDTESVFTCTSTVRDGTASVVVTGRVWVGDEDKGWAP